MKHFTLLVLIFWANLIYAQCPECTPDFTCTSAADFPSICPEVLPDATAGVYYESVMTFFLPANIVDPGSGISATLNQVVIGSVVGLPFGLSYVPNSPTSTYYPSNGENYGCATICGTPLQAGSYEVVINVTVTVTALGFEQVVNESFTLPIVVLPGVGGNSSFAYDNLNGCDSVTAIFEALINGAPGITNYSWDFGNGETSSDQFPDPQVYDQPGEYEVTLQTTIQNYFLNSVTVTSVENNWSGDIEELIAAFTSPDIYFTITNSAGNVIYTSSTIDSSTSGTWSEIGLMLDNPPYQINVWDEDNGPPLGSDDDAIGTASFAIQTGSQSFSSGGGANGSIQISLETTNVFNDSETVVVFDSPNADFTYLADIDVLDYDDPTLAYFEWFFNDELIQQGAQDSIFMAEPGLYSCTVTNIYGCSSTSEVFTLCPTLNLDYNWASGFFSVPAGYASYTWFFNGLPLPNATSNLLITSEPGNYALTITTDYGCEVSSEVYVITIGVENQERQQLAVWPNPANQQINIFVSQNETISLFDLGGKLIERWSTISGMMTLDVSDIQPGTYIMTLTSKSGLQRTKVVISR